MDWSHSPYEKEPKISFLFVMKQVICTNLKKKKNERDVLGDKYQKEHHKPFLWLANGSYPFDIHGYVDLDFP